MWIQISFISYPSWESERNRSTIIICLIFYTLIIEIRLYILLYQRQKHHNLIKIALLHSIVKIGKYVIFIFCHTLYFYIYM